MKISLKIKDSWNGKIKVKKEVTAGNWPAYFKLFLKAMDKAGYAIPEIYKERWKQDLKDFEKNGSPDMREEYAVWSSWPPPKETTYYPRWPTEEDGKFNWKRIVEEETGD